MHYYEVAPTQIVRSGSVSFTYHTDSPLPVGRVVVIEVGKKRLVGVILKQVPKPPYDTKTISDSTTFTLPHPLLQTILWMCDYYACHLALVLQTALPAGILKTRRERQSTLSAPIRERTNFLFTDEQRDALDIIETTTPGTFLLHGVTGSGKTAIYLEEARRTIERGRSIIVLVPEINLTPQLVSEFSHHFKNVILTHSRQTEAERHLAWKAVLESRQPQVIIGPRSALFMPASDIGLVVIDEAHEPSFKQEQSPRYSAQRVATILARHHKAKLILGSATPNVADYYVAQQSDRPILTMTQRAKQNAKPPKTTVVDMTKKANFSQHRFLSDAMLTSIKVALESGQVLLFHNRRGSATTTLCDSCGWSALCQRCFVPLTLHADTHSLNCHICAYKTRVPTSCPVCHSVNVIFKGIGTKLIESEIAHLYPKKRIMRLDGDNQQANIEELYKDLYSGDIDIIIGTQSITKGLDLPKLKMVGIIQADAGLSLPDFGASERTFQLLAQVVGRVGRSDVETEVIVQTYQPSHPAVVDGISQNYSHFYEATLQERQRSHFPPFSHLLKLTCSYKTEAAAIRNAQQLAKLLRNQLSTDVIIFGPTPSFYERQHGTYRWQLVLKSHRRALLIDALQHVPPTHWHTELDPISLL